MRPTTAKNAQSRYHNHPQRQPVLIAVLIPLPGGPGEPPCNVCDHILTQTKNKFRVKEPNIVYRWGGEVVYDGETLPERIEKVLVNKREAYIGPLAKHTRIDGKAGEVNMEV